MVMHDRSRRVRRGHKLALVVAAAAMACGGTGAITSVCRASHLDPPLVNTLRQKMTGEGYLEFQVNPGAGRFGEEWTGWVDIRHPARDGTTQAFDPFDYSNRFVNVKTIIVTDNAGVEARPGGQPANTGIGIRRDFDYANKIWMQAGMSVIREGGGTITMNGMNGAPNRAWPANDATLDALNALQRSPNAATVNTYYLKDIIDGNGNHPNGSTGAPAQFGGNVPRNDGVNMADAAVNNTFAHELGHMILNDGAQHYQIGGDTAHSGDRTNLMWPDGSQAAQSFAQVGMIGRHDIVTSSQALRVFGNAGANNPGLVQRNPIDTTYANRVDWDFVADHGQLSFNHNNTIDGGQATVTGGAETVGNNVDEQNPPDVDSLFFGINPNMPGHTDPATHDHTGLGAFPATPNFNGSSFRLVDVFSMALRYNDYDQGNTGGQSLKESALDYDVFFRGLDGSVVAGQPLLAYQPGWTDLTNADNYLTRWMSPVDANGVFVFAHNGNGHDYTCQIDAVIAAVPEPATGGFAGAAMSLMFARRRRRR